MSPLAPVSPAPGSARSDARPYVDLDAQQGTLQGEVRRGAPFVSEDGVDPSRPYAGVAVDILDAAGLQVTRVTSDAAGTFSVMLPAGGYQLRPRWPVTQLYPVASQQPDIPVLVPAGGAASVRLLYTVGIY